MFQHDDVSAAEALARMQRARLFAQPNAGFLAQLSKLEPMRHAAGREASATLCADR
ncbi:hypothetical protein M885DRAFT_567956 [Pelagophyceae sp. CCMP2097]|nr:hypothetical protein M885DRAFT_567956 [Pelagophyceae sp. CCMP2097]